MRTAYLLAFLLTLVPAAARSADATGTYMTPLSVGTLGCPEFLAARDRARQAKPAAGRLGETDLFTSYVSGFQTAFNLLVPETCDIFAGLSPDQMLAWMDNYCRGQPQRTFGAAVIALMEANHPSRSKSCK